MTQRPPYTPITVDFYRQLPEGPPYYELIEGKLITSPSPSFFHQRILIRLSSWIEEYTDKHPVGIISIAPSDVFLDEINALQPDLYFISKKRKKMIGETGAEGAPDLVVEILSPSNAKRDRDEKRSIYARAGVKEMWIIDPKLRQIEVYSLALANRTSPRILAEPKIFEPKLFPGLKIDTTKLFKPAV